LQCHKALDAVVEIAAFVRMWKEVSHVGQALVGRWSFQLKDKLKS